MNLNNLGGIIWLSIPIILSILLIPWLLMMLFILKGKTNKRLKERI